MSPPWSPQTGAVGVQTGPLTQRVGRGGLGAEEAAQAEVTELHDARGRDEHVGRLDVCREGGGGRCGVRGTEGGRVPRVMGDPASSPAPSSSFPTYKWV